MQRPELHIESVPWDFQADDARAGLIPQQPAPMPGPPMLGLGGDPAAASAPAPGGPADGPPVRRKKKKRRHRVARETALPEAFSSLTSFRGGTRLNMFEPQDPAVAPELRKMRSMREMGLEELMARAGMAPPGAETDSPGREPEMEQIRLGRTTPVPLFPLSALEMGAETAKKKKKKKKRHHHHHRKRDGEVDLGEIDLGTYSHPVIDIEGEIAGPLEPPSPRQDEKPEMFLPIPPPPPAPTMPGWLSPLFPFVGTLAPFLASRHPNLATNILSRAWILLLLAVWIVVSYVPFLPPSGTSKFATDAMNYTTALHNAGNAIYSVSTRAGYEQFRHVASLNVNSGAPGAILPPWPEFAKQKSVNGSKILTPKQACINFLEQRDWTLPGYSITGIPDATVSNDTSLVDIKWLGSQVPGWGVSRYNGGPGLRSAVEYLTDTLDRLTGMSFQNARVADIQKVIDGIYTRDSDPQIDWSSQSTEFPDVIDGETGDYVVPKIGLRTVVTSGINWISVHVPSNVAGSNKEAIILVAGIDTRE